MWLRQSAANPYPQRRLPAQRHRCEGPDPLQSHTFHPTLQSYPRRITLRAVATGSSQFPVLGEDKDFPNARSPRLATVLPEYDAQWADITSRLARPDLLATPDAAVVSNLQ